MEEESYAQVFDRLNNKLHAVDTPIVTDVATPISNNNSSAAPKINFALNPLYIYGGVPIAVLFIFVISQPGFLKDKYKDEKGETATKTNFKKVFIWTVVISVVINSAIFAYFYQQKKKKL